MQGLSCFTNMSGISSQPPTPPQIQTGLFDRVRSRAIYCKSVLTHSSFKNVLIFSSFSFLFFLFTCYFFLLLLTASLIPDTIPECSQLSFLFSFLPSVLQLHVYPYTTTSMHPNSRSGSYYDINQYPTEPDLGFLYCQSGQYIEFSIFFLATFGKKKSQGKKSQKTLLQRAGVVFFLDGCVCHTGAHSLK